MSEPVVPGYEFSDNDINRSDFDVIGFACGLNDYKRAVHKTAVEHGWWEVSDDTGACNNCGMTRNFGEMVALMHSELSEALEAWRGHDIVTQIKYEYPPFGESPALVLYQPEFLYATGAKELGKPVGVASEFADVIIRILDTCEKLQIPVTEALVRKHRYNLTRPYRHGGKKA